MPDLSEDVKICLPDGSKPFTIKNADEQLAFYWSHVVRSRGRWRYDAIARDELVRDARASFRELQVKPEDLRRIAKAGAVEVAIPYSEKGWAPRILPWEFLLDELTRDYRNAGQMLLVTRHLVGTPARKKAAKHGFAFVENNPPPFLRRYNYESESTVVCRQLRAGEKPLTNPTLEELNSYIRDNKPAVIHLAGVDSHQGREILSAWGEPIPSDFERADGLIMQAAQRGWESVNEHRLADALTNKGRHAPSLVSFNIYNSGARLAPIAVARGAKAALGFYDSFDDALAEKFFAIFYQRLRLGGNQVGSAFKAAIEEMRKGARTGGAYVVLWTSESVLSQLDQAVPEQAEPKKSEQCKDRLFVSALPVSRVNYARLQAKEPLFTRFNIIRLDRDGDIDVQVEAKLFVGADSFPYRRQLKLTPGETVYDLSAEIQLPMLSTLQRSLRDGVQTLVQYSVKRTGTEDAAIDESRPVELSAINEWWWDPFDDSRYLASFILPNDPAVLQIISEAQPFLHALRDDFGAGFDGYQSIDQSLDEPSWAVDQQVRAIWSVLSFKLSLHYINPPPVFADASQRLRTPSDVVRGRRGTCIDLALLLAACVEFVDIFPVIFVLKDHAFPGYWRSEVDRDSFRRMRDDPGGKRSELGDVREYVDSGKLIPLETVLLTNHSGFDDAVSACSDSLADESRWGRLLDVKTARTLGATPIPILETER